MKGNGTQPESICCFFFFCSFQSNAMGTEEIDIEREIFFYVNFPFVFLMLET